MAHVDSCGRHNIRIYILIETTLSSSCCCSANRANCHEMFAPGQLKSACANFKCLGIQPSTGVQAQTAHSLRSNSRWCAGEEEIRINIVKSRRQSVASKNYFPNFSLDRTDRAQFMGCPCPSIASWLPSRWPTWSFLREVSSWRLL